MFMLPDPSEGMHAIEEADDKMNRFNIDRVIDDDTKRELFSDDEAEQYARAGQIVIMRGIELEDMLPGLYGKALFTMTRGGFWENLGIPGVKSLESWWQWWDDDCRDRGLRGAPRSVSRLQELQRVYYHHHFRLAKPEDDPLIQKVGNVDKLDKIARDFTKRENHDELLDYVASRDLNQVVAFAAEAKKIHDATPGITVNVAMVERALDKKKESGISEVFKASRLPFSFRGKATGDQYIKVVDTEYLDDRTYRQTYKVQDNKD